MPSQLLSLVVAMLPSLRAMERRLDLETGRRFNIFYLFPINENATSNILAFLLDPNEAHGQNDLFLKLFIKQFVPEWKNTFKYSMVRRASTHEPIDIVNSDGPFWLGIENKIFDAPEQNRQAERYLDSLREVASQDYRLLYLSPDGAGPSEFSLPNKASCLHRAKLVRGAWAQADRDGNRKATPPTSILDWLAVCRNHCRAENVDWLVRQFASYIRSTVSGQKESDMVNEAIVAMVLRDQETLQAALLIHESYNAIREKILGDFLSCVHDGLAKWAADQDSDWEVKSQWSSGSWIQNPCRRWLPLLLRRKKWPSMVGVAIQAEGTEAKYVIIGVIAPTQATWQEDLSNEQFFGSAQTFAGPASRERIIQRLQEERNRYQTSPWWPLHETLNDATGTSIRNWSDRKMLARLQGQKEDLCHQILSQMVELAEKLGDLQIDSGAQ